MYGENFKSAETIKGRRKDSPRNEDGFLETDSRQRLVLGLGRWSSYHFWPFSFRIICWRASSPFRTADDTALLVLGKGTVVKQVLDNGMPSEVRLCDEHLSPGIYYKLLSLGTIEAQGYSIQASNDQTKVTDNLTNEICMDGTCDGTSYKSWNRLSLLRKRLQQRCTQLLVQPYDLPISPNRSTNLGLNDTDVWRIWISGILRDWFISVRGLNPFRPVHWKKKMLR